MKHLFTAVLLIVVIGVGVFFLTKDASDAPIVGVLLPLTGKSASIGERVKAGIEAGAAELKETSGIDLTIVYEDDKGEATAAVSGIRKLLDADNASVIIGTVKSDAMLAVAPITEERQIVLLSPTAGADAISSAGDFAFRVIETAEAHGKAAASRLEGKRVALLIANASNAESYGAAYKRSAKAPIYESAYVQDENDYRSIIASARAAKADAFYLAVATAKDAGLMVRQIRETGFSGIIMASVAADAAEFFTAAGPYAEDTIITASYFDKTSPEGTVFNERYRAITGMDGDGFAANGYDAIMLLGSALKNCGEDSACIRDTLYATKDYVGAGGTLSFDENGDVQKPVIYKHAEEGAFVVER